MDSFAGLQIGDLVALRTETLQDAPWIVQVTGTEGEKSSIVRMEGTTTAVLTPSSLALATSSWSKHSRKVLSPSSHFHYVGHMLAKSKFA